MYVYLNSIYICIYYVTFFGAANFKCDVEFSYSKFEGILIFLKPILTLLLLYFFQITQITEFLKITTFTKLPNCLKGKVVFLFLFFYLFSYLHKWNAIMSNYLTGNEIFIYAMKRKVTIMFSEPYENIVFGYWIDNNFPKRLINVHYWPSSKTGVLS